MRVDGSKPKICFVALNIYHLLTRKSTHQGMGGAEFQQMLLARELACRGYRVCFLTVSHAENEIDASHPFELIQTFDRKAGLPGVRFYYPRLFEIWRGLKRADADIYYLRSRSFNLGVVTFFARRFNRKVVYCGANDLDFDKKRVPIHNFRDKFLFTWGLKHCDEIVVQNSTQLKTLEENYGRRGQVISNGFYTREYTSQHDGIILWVGSIKKVKNPLDFLYLARRLPQQKFVMVGGCPPKDSAKQQDYYERVVQEARQIPNLQLTGFLPFEQVEDYFQKAKLLVNTSPVEGFPNTFLQAWARGVPVLSYVNPNEFLTREHLGLVARDKDDLVRQAESFSQNGSSFSPSRIKAFFDAHLSLDKTVAKYETIFQTLFAKMDVTAR